MPVEEMMLYYSPLIFDIVAMQEGSVSLYDEDKNYIFPESLSPSLESIKNKGMLLMDCGEFIIFYINP